MYGANSFGESREMREQKLLKASFIERGLLFFTSELVQQK
jgi:hypothetical protein